MARHRTPKTCVHCGATNLYWQKDVTGVVHLHNPTGTPHGGPRGDCPSWGKGSKPVMPTPADVADVLADEHQNAVESKPATQPSNAPTVQPAHNPNAALYDLVKPYVQDDILSALEGFRPAEQIISHRIEVMQDAEVKAIIADAHPLTADLISFAAQRLHCMLVGPAGSGKTYAAKLVAQALGLNFYPMSVGPQTSKSDFLGYTNASTGEYVRTGFRDCFEYGGVFLLDEVDAGNAGVMTILNAALSGAPTLFPDGKVIAPHADFIVIASANTYGHGASRQYVGRNQLDAATLDRFIGLDWDYDRNLELKLAGEHRQWAEYVWSLRSKSATLGIRAVFGTRRIMQGAKLLSAGVSRARVEQVTVWFGVSADDKAKLTAGLR